MIATFNTVNVIFIILSEQRDQLVIQPVSLIWLFQKEYKFNEQKYLCKTESSEAT